MIIGAVSPSQIGWLLFYIETRTKLPLSSSPILWYSEQSKFAPSQFIYFYPQTGAHMSDRSSYTSGI